MGERRRIVDLAVVIFVAVVAVVLFWPSISGNGSNGDDFAGNGPDVAEEATPTSRGESTPTPDPDEIAVDSRPCVPGDASQLLVDFIRSFNRGDQQALAAVLPVNSAPSLVSSLYTGMPQDQLMSFGMHDVGPSNSRDEILELLDERHQTGEHWILYQFSVQRLYRDESLRTPELIQATASIGRRSPAFPDHTLEGTAVFNCNEDLIVIWDFGTDDPELAEPISIEQFLAGLGPYGIGELRSMRMFVSIDQRPDGGGMTEWEIRREEATSYAGDFVERIEIFDLEGTLHARHIYDGRNWHLEQRGWSVSDDQVSAPELPLEIVSARREPSTTGRLLRTIDADAFDDRELSLGAELSDNADLLNAISRMLGVDVEEIELDVEIVDGAVRASTYRFLGPAGAEIANMEIRWIAMSRTPSYDLRLFELPWGLMRARQQYHPPDSLPSEVEISPEPLEIGGFREHYTINWRGIPMTLLVSPSMGGLSPHARGELWTDELVAEIEERDAMSALWADGHGSGYPSHVVWDNGRFRFELRVEGWIDPGDVDWNLDQMTELITALSSAN